MAQWWEKEPVNFECQKDCIQCCSKPGWVYFDKQDVTQVSSFLGLSSNEFRRKYGLMPEGPDLWEMGVTENEPCPFLEPTGCAIHPVKPKQCRAFPFWEENLRTRKDWHKTGEDCPGIGKGQAWKPEVIRINKNSIWS